MAETVLLLAAGLMGGDGDPCHPVHHFFADCVELNSYFGSDGVRNLSQLIWWDWHMGRQEYGVVAWMMAKHDNHRPTRHRNGWRTIYWTGQGMFVITAASRRITWTQYDPEILDRAKTPREGRRGFWANQ